MASGRARVAATMAAEADRLIDSFDDHQREVAVWPFPSDEERRLWFYTPTDHGGLTLAAMTQPQHRVVFRLIASGLSTPGYVTASTIIGLENVLDQLEGFTASFERPRGRDPLMYFLRFFGQPSTAGTWSWRLGGHHISLNFTIIDGELAATTPLFLGADPASAPLLGPHPLRPLAGVEDLARELVRSLSSEQRDIAVVSPRAPTDLVGANRSSLADGDRPIPLPQIWRRVFDGDVGDQLRRAQQRLDTTTGVEADDLEAMAFTRQPKGLAAKEMSTAQRDMLDALLRLYVHRLPEDVADEEALKFAGAALDEVHFLWAGGLAPGQPHYYRLHSATLLAEYDNSARDANHVHTVWRDPRGDFGDDPLARHHAEHDHG
ncbi:MAG TPA: DUF3500 domain-containing protein [Ilumatobacteraceae bacterium]|nr:DUF3500 domain-containing protein [Ilumatobacteraceae bacterium]